MMPVGSPISSPKALSWDAPTKKVPQIWVFQGTIGPVIVDQDQRWCRVSEPLDPGKALQRHYCERKWLDERLPESFDGNTVVVTHHKRPKPIRNLLVRDCLSSPEYGPSRVKIFFAPPESQFDWRDAVEFTQSQREGPNHCADVYQCLTFV
jgi:hypothetical protein